jgi:hypothetical protein
MFKPIPDNDEANEVVPASYPAGLRTVTAHGIPIRKGTPYEDSASARWATTTR